MSAAERVGQLLGNDLAGRVIECFDFCVIQNRVAACVSVRWSTLAVQRRELIENAFWDEPGPDAVAEAHVRMDDFNDSMQETIAQNAAAVAAASQPWKAFSKDESLTNSVALIYYQSLNVSGRGCRERRSSSTSF